MHFGIKIGNSELIESFLFCPEYDEEKQMARPTKVSLLFLFGGRTFNVEYKINPKTLEIESYENRVPLNIFTKGIFEEGYRNIQPSTIEWAISKTCQKTLSGLKATSPVEGEDAMRIRFKRPSPA